MDIGDRLRPSRTCRGATGNGRLLGSRLPAGSRYGDYGVHRWLVRSHALLVLMFVLVEIFAVGCARERRLAGYDRFGPYTVPSGGNVVKMLDDLRGFVWTHWRERRRGYAVVTTIDVFEHVPCTSTYIIEPDEYGQWYVEEHAKCKGHILSESERVRGVSVQRLAVDNAGRRTDKFLPDSAVVPPGSYILMLRDKFGNDKHEL